MLLVLLCPDLQRQLDDIDRRRRKQPLPEHRKRPVELLDDDPLPHTVPREHLLKRLAPDEPAAVRDDVVRVVVLDCRAQPRPDPISAVDQNHRDYRDVERRLYVLVLVEVYVMIALSTFRNGAHMIVESRVKIYSGAHGPSRPLSELPRREERVDVVRAAVVLRHLVDRREQRLLAVLIRHLLADQLAQIRHLLLLHVVLLQARPHDLPLRQLQSVSDRLDRQLAVVGRENDQLLEDKVRQRYALDVLFDVRVRVVRLGHRLSSVTDMEAQKNIDRSRRVRQR